jgi:hypothetical protein
MRKKDGNGRNFGAKTFITAEATLLGNLENP